MAAVDGRRAAVRLLGAQLAAAGRLADPEDVFHLTRAELAARPPAAT